MRVASWAAVAGQILFALGGLVAEVLEGHGYSVADHTISDLGLATQAICGVATILFGLVALRRMLDGVRGRTFAGVLVATSALGLGSVSDALFRLNCRAADGCTSEQATASWQGKVQGLAGLTGW